MSSPSSPAPSADCADPAIRAVGLTRRFETVTAVDDVDLEVPAGTVFGFLGPNGAGKTTTIRLLLGLIEPSAGSARVLGHDPLREGESVRRSAVCCWSTRGSTSGCRPRRTSSTSGACGISRRPCSRRASSSCSTHFGLADRRDELVGTWSRGMKQKVALARALLHRPRVIFLDEPTAGLDPVAAAGLRHDLLDLARRETVTVFITTHNLDEAARTCDRVGVIRGGRLVAEGPPDELGRPAGHTVTIRGSGFEPALDELRRRPEVRSVTADDGTLSIEFASADRAAPIVRLLVERGADVEEVRKDEASLEAAFLALLQEPEVPT